MVAWQREALYWSLRAVVSRSARERHADKHAVRRPVGAGGEAAQARVAPGFFGHACAWVLATAFAHPGAARAARHGSATAADDVPTKFAERIRSQHGYRIHALDR